MIQSDSIETHERIANLKPAKLENWYRSNYFNNEIDISGSGVQDYTFGELRSIVGIDFDQLNPLPVKDASTIGCFETRKEIAALFGDGDPNKVLLTSGGNEALYYISRAILQPSDHIITLGPCYHCHDGIAESIGCAVSKWELDIKKDYTLAINDLRSLIESNTKAVFLNFPNNPTGATITPDLLKEIILLADKYELYIIWDAVFQKLVYERPELPDPIKTYSRTISVGSFSKMFGCPGLRFGWIISNVDIFEACVRQRDYGNLYVPPIIEFLALKILRAFNDLFKPRLRQARVNREIVDDFVSNTDGLSWIKPRGGVCGLVRIPSFSSDTEFCRGLLYEKGVLLVPGSCFNVEQTFRIGFGGQTDILTEGLKRLNQYIMENL